MFRNLTRLLTIINLVKVRRGQQLWMKHIGRTFHALTGALLQTAGDVAYHCQIRIKD